MSVLLSNIIYLHYVHYLQKDPRPTLLYHL